MTLRTPFLILLITCSQPIFAESIFDNPRLDEFVTDLLDRSDKRHYQLVSKQSAIHKWLVRNCMRTVGIRDDENPNSKAWQEAKYGEYAYCQDHHIPGIDPPCPSSEIVDLSIDNSCFQIAYDKIDWSHQIMNVAREYLVDEWTLDESDPTVQAIESSWSSCMAHNGYSYKSRFEMYSSFAQTRTTDTPEDVSEKSKDSEVLQSAETCYNSTDYYQKRKEYANSMSANHLREKEGLLKTLLERYEAAEHFANATIDNYCNNDRSAIVNMYEQEKLTEALICD